MEYVRIYLVTLLPVVAAIVMVYLNFHIKKKIKQLQDKKKEEYIVEESEKELAEYLEDSKEGDLLKKHHDSDSGG